MKIAANKTADICVKALTALGGEVSINRDEREKILEEIMTDEVDDILSECDNQFYEYPDNLVDLCYQFIIDNKDQFTRR